MARPGDRVAIFGVDRLTPTMHAYECGGRTGCGRATMERHAGFAFPRAVSLPFKHARRFCRPCDKCISAGYDLGP